MQEAKPIRIKGAGIVVLAHGLILLREENPNHFSFHACFANGATVEVFPSCEELNEELSKVLDTFFNVWDEGAGSFDLVSAINRAFEEAETS